MYSTQGNIDCITKINKRKGAVLLLFIMGVMVLFLILGIFVFDMGRVMAIKTDLYNVANAAALAGVKRGYDEHHFMYTGKRQLIEDKTRAGVQEMVQANQRKEANYQYKCTPENIKINHGVNTVTVTLTAEVPTMFMKIVGIDKIPISGESSAALKQKR